MQPITTSTPGRKRQLIFVPEINAKTFLFFFEKGTTGGSYSLRDYSLPHRVVRKDAREIGWTADEIRHKAVYAYDAPLLDTNRLDAWHACTTTLNERHGLAKSEIEPNETVHTESFLTPSCNFPLLNIETFRTLPKAAKTGDVSRMQASPQSEDWLTWNLLNLLTDRSDWWARLGALIEAENPTIDQSILSVEPSVRFWEKTASPRKYEAESRARMRASSDPVLVARSRDAKPVEGPSEIDLVIESDSFIIFVEAKLNSDISMRTTYDPSRNQIVRNIDCLLERANGRTAYFWMFVHDVSPARAYVQLMEQYRTNPETLLRELPHRDPSLLRKVAANLALATWLDIGKEECEPEQSDDEELASVKCEVLRRIQ